MIVIVSCDNLVFVVLDLQSMVVSDCCGDLGLVMLVLDCLGENLFGFQELIRKLKGDPLQNNNKALKKKTHLREALRNSRKSTMRIILPLSP